MLLNNNFGSVSVILDNLGVCMKFGIDRLLNEESLRKQLQGKRIALLAHPASLTHDFKPSVDALAECDDLNLVCCFGPQHGMRGDKQDNMVESENIIDTKLGIPVYSLYGEVRRPTAEMLDSFDVLLYDIQDVGCRIYTFITTLFYLLEDCAREAKELWVLDRPNLAGREIEGFILETGNESFVGATEMPMRHGLTTGEAANWYKAYKNLDVILHVVAMEDYSMTTAPDYGWPTQELCWVNPSPNMVSVNAARVYSGTVLLEGTTLSEGRGTTRPLELFGAPDLDIPAILTMMKRIAPQWMQGCHIREVWFEPTFHKYQGELCAGIQLHTDYPDYQPEDFKPFRFIMLFLKAIRQCYPNYKIWRDFPYEYELDRLAIDVINGGNVFREWVDGESTDIEAIEQKLVADEKVWLEQVRAFYLY